MSVACSQNLCKFQNPEEEKLQQNIPGKGVKRQLEILCNIYALSLLHNHQGDFLSTSTITSEQGSLVNDQLRSLYSQARPNAVGLVDAFNYTDHFLGSILGCYDGNVYPRLYEAAWKDPLNESVVPDGYHEYIRPLLKQQFHNARL
ncbi:Acyl-CoA oxidase, C-terminal [Dillenia turbinata]|uniref:Acyl-CoA oxidase, C-terminal n=1 Tax=Dillenia turbinata TaxID=194707 RepID=A0AAN8VNT6_9MAGN